MHVLAYDCKVGKDSIEIGKEVPVLLEDENLKKIADPLVEWYRENKRELPWREQISAYRVWVSEIMLQQTRVEAVKPFYARFLNALPTVKDLAEAEEDQLLKLWEGLGYYNRVRNMQKAAKQIMEDFHGEFPKTYEEIKKSYRNRKLYGGSNQLICIWDSKTGGRWQCTSCGFEDHGKL